MRDFLLIAGISLAAILLGSALFFFGPKSLQSDVNSALLSGQIGPTSPTSFVLLEQGVNAISISTRTNYRITTSADLAALWPIVYGQRNAPNIPVVDFNKYEVLAIFDGTHSVGGYDVKVAGIKDVNPTRTVIIDHLVPSSSCVAKGPSNPFQIIQVPKTSFVLSHQDITGTSTCSTN